MTNDRIDTICEVRSENRKDIGDLLYQIVDLKDLFPGDPTAEQYTITRRATIDATLASQGDNDKGCI